MIKIISNVILILIVICGLVSAQEIKLESISGTLWHNQPDSIMAGSSYVFHIRYSNLTDSAYKSFSNGFRIYSPDNAQWTTTEIDTSGSILNNIFDNIFGNISYSVSGSFADTILVFGSAVFGSGMEQNFNDQVFSIRVGPIPSGFQYDGQTICLDSVSITSGFWKWTTPSYEHIPTWDGPYCYTIVEEVANDVHEISEISNSYTLYQNFPNPYNPSTTIQFETPIKSDVQLSIYNLLGQLVREYNIPNCPVGVHQVKWSATNKASGFYYYILKTETYSETKKMLLLK